MTTKDLPIVAFFKRILDPTIIWGLLILITFLHNEDFNGHYLVLVIITFCLSTYIFEQTPIYKNWRRARLMAYIRDTLLGWSIIIITLLLIGFAAKYYDFYSKEVILTWFIVTPFALIASHLVAYYLIIAIRKKDKTRSSIVIGANETSYKLIQSVKNQPFLLIKNHGYFDQRNESRLKHNLGQRLGDLDDVLPYIHKQNIEMVFISLPLSSQPRIRNLIDQLPDTTTSVYFLPDTNLFDLMHARFDYIGGIPMIAMYDSAFSDTNSLVKDASDFIIALFLLILFLPLMLFIAVAVKISSPGPIIFKQRRYGLNGEEIIVYKFRSMTVAEDGENVVQAKKNDQRVTKIGRILRCTSLDELPQFINVLQGRMSIVGPRPHAVAHNELYRKLIKGYMLRHKAKPGITGWAQVNGFRGETEELEKMKARIEHDLEYLQNWTIWLDLWIMVRTVWVILGRNNAY